MKVLLLADINSSHTRKWVEELHKNGFDVGVFSISNPTSEWYIHSGIQAFVPLQFNQSVFSGGLLSKVRYLKLVPYLKKLIRNYNPDIVHAHYASSYGLLGALSGFHPLVVSVWGSDIYFFAKTPLIGNRILKFNFSRADKILSTSKAMIGEIKKYTQKEITVTPFGIDTDVFKPIDVKSFFKEGDIVIGTVKALEQCYGINYLILAFSKLVVLHPELPLKLLIVGGGSLEKDLKNLAESTGLTDRIHFTGRVAYDEVAVYHNYLDVYVALSTSESFGVAILEASACGKPVVVSDVGGLPEVVADRQTGFIVNSANVNQAAEAIEKLMLDKNLRSSFGSEGRKRVIEFYNWHENVKLMLRIYNEIVPLIS